MAFETLGRRDEEPHDDASVLSSIRRDADIIAGEANQRASVGDLPKGAAEVILSTGCRAIGTWCRQLLISASKG